MTCSAAVLAAALAAGAGAGGAGQPAAGGGPGEAPGPGAAPEREALAQVVDSPDWPEEAAAVEELPYSRLLERVRLGGDEPTQDISANELMWAFFEAHPKP